MAASLLTAGALIWSGCATTLAPAEGVSLYGEHVSIEQPGSVQELRQMKAQQMFIRGMTAALGGDHRLAVDLFEQVLRIEPDAAAVLSALADSYEALGTLNSALYYAEKAVALRPDNRFYFEQLAALQLEVDNIPGAIATYESLLDLFPREVEARFELARLQTLSGRLTQSLATYKQIIQQIGEDQQIYYRILHIHNLLNDPEGIRQTLDAMLKIEPDDPSLLRMVAELYVEQRMVGEAIGILEQLIAQHPQELESALMLAELYRMEGRHDKADAVLTETSTTEHLSASFLTARAAALYLQADDDPDAARTASHLLKRAIELEPDKTEALFMLGDLLYRDGDYSEAGALLKRAVAIDPRNPQAWLQAAAASLQVDEPGEALEIAEEALLLFPGQFPLLRLAGFAALEVSAHRSAIAYLDDAIHVLAEEEPENQLLRADLYATIGLLYARLKETPESDNAYAAAIAANPDHAVALNNYAYSLSERGLRLEEALEMATRAVEIEPENASFLDTLGWVYFKMGDFEEAGSWIARSIATGQASAVVHEHYGDIQQRLGDKDEALHYWEKALLMNPANEGLQQKIDSLR